MKKTTLLLSTITVLSLLFANQVFAGNNISLSISCTIPAIPGLNAPSIEEQKLETKTEAPAEAKAEFKEETPALAHPLVLEDNQEAIAAGEEQENLVFVKTIYSR